MAAPCQVPDRRAGNRGRRRWWRGGAAAQGKPAAHVQPDLTVGGDVRPEQRGKATQVVRAQLGQALVEDVLDHEGVEVHHGALQDPQAQHRQFLLVAPVGRDVAALAEVDDGVSRVPRLGDVQARVDLALQLPVAEVAGHEQGPLRPAGLQHRLVGRVHRVGALEPAQDRGGLRGAGADRRGVLDHLVVLVGDQVPPDRPADHRGGKPRVGVAGAGSVEPDAVDRLDPRQQVEAEQPGQPEPDDGLAVGVGVVGLDVHAGAVVHRALDHRGYLAGGAVDDLGVDHHALALDVPVDQHAAAAVAGVPLSEDVLVERPEVGGVRRHRR